MQLVNQLENLCPGGRVEVARRLIREGYWGENRQCACTRHTLTLATGELGRKMIHSVFELNHTEQFFRPFLNFRPRPATKVQRQCDILEAVERRQEIEELKYEADLVTTHARQVVVWQIREILVLDRNRSAAGTVQTPDQV